MSDLRTAAQQALEVMSDISSFERWSEVRDALKAALAEPVQEFATTNIGCLGMPVNTPVTPPQTAEPVQDAVAQISANRVIAAIEEWKSLWWKVPPFASKVNRATREAITVSHNPLFALLLDAQAAKQMPKGCTTPSGCQQHGCHGECLPTEPQRPAKPVQEPVAWRWKAVIDGDRISNWVLTHSEPPPYAVAHEPLYAHPPQPDASCCTRATCRVGQRVPLTDEEIVDAVRQADLDWQAGWTLDEHEPNRFTTITRVIEQAHGIGDSDE